MTIRSKAAPVRFDAVTKAFGDVVAVDEISMEIAPGQLVTPERSRTGQRQAS